MRWVVRHAKQVLDHGGDALGRPHIADEAKRRRPFCEFVDQVCPLFAGQAR
jgi:hypothetical protein